MSVSVSGAPVRPSPDAGDIEITANRIVVADHSGQTAPDPFGFGPALIFSIPQFDFIKIALALVDGQLGHLGALRDRFVFRNGSINRIFIDDRLTAFSHIMPFDVTQNRLGGLFASPNGTDGHPGAGLQIAAGKYTLALGGIGDRIDFCRPPAGIG